MTKFIDLRGFIFYRTSLKEILDFGGLGICDHCNEFCPLGGVYVPVLNHWCCPSCFQEWISDAKYYPEDDWFQSAMASEFESVIPVTRTLEVTS